MLNMLNNLLLIPNINVRYSLSPISKSYERRSKLDPQFCSNLTEFSDICNISTCIESVEGLASNSVSNTDTWVVNFKNRVNYDRSSIKKGFIKLWLSRTCVEYKLTKVFNKNFPNRTEKNKLIEKHLEEIDSLNYEAKVYRDIVKDLVDSNICPNFIRFLGLGQNCSFSSVSGMLESTLGTKKDIAFYRNVLLLIRSEGLNRRSTTDISSISEYLNNTTKQIADDKKFASLQTVTDNSTFTVLLNEAIKSGTKSWDAYAPGLFNNDNTLNIEISRLLFQLMASIYAMSLSGLTHNDLHQKNAYVEECDRKQVSYVYGGQTFNFETKYVVKVFDFDRSYNKRLKDNEILETYCYASQCNKYIPNLDAMKVMGDLYRYFVKRPICQQILLDICAPSTRNVFKNSTFIPQDLLRETWNHGPHLIDPKTNTGLTAEDYEGFSSVFYILEKLATSGIINSVQNYATLENTYICHENMFDENGKIKPTNVSRKNYLDKLNAELRNDKTKLNKSNSELLYTQQNLYKSTVKLQEENTKLIRSNNELQDAQQNLYMSKSKLQKEKDEINKLNNTLNARISKCDNKLKEQIKLSTEYFKNYNDCQNMLDNKDFDDMHLSGTRLLEFIEREQELKNENYLLKTELRDIRQSQDEINQRLELKRKRSDEDNRKNKKINDGVEFITRKLKENFIVKKKDK
jgi:hypothetical protein